MARTTPRRPARAVGRAGPEDAMRTAIAGLGVLAPLRLDLVRAAGPPAGRAGRGRRRRGCSRPTRRGHGTAGRSMPQRSCVRAASRSSRWRWPPQTGPGRAYSAAEAASAAAEELRLTGEAVPSTWRAVASSGRPVTARTWWRYMPAREAEALMVAGDRSAAAEVLRTADAVAASLGARPLREAIASLARGRLDLDEPAPPTSNRLPPRRRRTRTG